MKNIHSIAFYTGSKEELLPDFEEDFPYIASRAELDKYIGRFVPWHWYKTVELFYMESGCLEYNTPGKVFREYAHCSPTEYRKKWQDCDKSGQK